MTVEVPMKYALLINEVFTMAAPCGTVAPIICQIDKRQLVLSAKPAKGDRLEGAALDIIGEVVRKLRKADVLFHTHERNGCNGAPGRPDLVCIWARSVPEWLVPLLPTSAGRYIEAQKKLPPAVIEP